VLPIIPSLIRVLREFGAVRLNRPARAASFDRPSSFATHIVLAFANHSGALIISGFTAPTNWLTGVSKSNGFPDDVRFFWLYGSDDRASHNCGLSGCRFTAAPEARTDVTQI
jgi:hypothetical protein